MEWRIRKNSRTNEYVAEYGGKVESHPVGGEISGYYMPAFIVSHSACFDTKNRQRNISKDTLKEECNYGNCNPRNPERINRSCMGTA